MDIQGQVATFGACTYSFTTSGPQVMVAVFAHGEWQSTAFLTTGNTSATLYTTQDYNDFTAQAALVIDDSTNTCTLNSTITFSGGQIGPPVVVNGILGTWSF